LTLVSPRCTALYSLPFTRSTLTLYWARWRRRRRIEAEKHGDRSEPLAALVAEARTMIELARAEQAERARAAAEEPAVQAACSCGDGGCGGGCRAPAARGEALAVEVQQLQAELGSGSGHTAAGCGGDDMRGVL
jgi:hypothetical protein